MGFTGFDWVVLVPMEVDCVSVGFNMSFTMFYWVLLGFPRSNGALLG